MGLSADDLEMAARLLAALAAGSVIGYERSFHGRPAGFRTHALVCLASSVLMLVTVYEAHWMREAAGRVQIDPTRMAQGILTGIGFLGAGVILREGLSIRGLTTAAGIWMTAAIGVAVGLGHLGTAAIGALFTWTVLAVVLKVEQRIEGSDNLG